VEIDEQEFKRRFVVGRVFLLVPAFWAVLTLAWIINPHVFWSLLATHIAVLAVAGWLAARSAKRHLEFAREMGPDMVTFGIPDNVRSHLFPLTGAVLIVGSINGIIRHDWRWVLLALALAGLLGEGSLFVGCCTNAGCF
jgi:hypothetical protein